MPSIPAARTIASLALFWAAHLGAAVLPPAAPSATCIVDGQVEDVLFHDGAVYLAGRFLHVRPPGTGPGDPLEQPRTWFAACDAATGAVLPWNPAVECVSGGGPCANARGQTIALAPDGATLYLGGKFDRVGGATQKHATRVAIATAVRDGAFNPDPNDRVQRIVVSPDATRVYIGGNFTRVGGCLPAPCHEHLVAVDPVSGAAVAGFDPAIATAVGSFLTVYSLAVDAANETVYFGGQFDLVNGAARTSVAAIDVATGQVNRDFAPHLEDANVADPFPQVHDVRLDGSFVYVCGDWWTTGRSGDQHDQRNVNRFDPATGAVDEDFWIATDGGVQGCALDPGLGLLFVGGHFDCVRAWFDRETPVDPNPPQCGGDDLFVGTLQRDLFALDLRSGDLVDWNPNTSGIAGTWAVAASPGRLDLGGQLGWPFSGSPTSQNLLAFELPLFVDGFESESTGRWSAELP